MATIRITVQGHPVAQPRPRARRMGDHATVYNPSGSSRDWKHWIKMAAEKEMKGRAPIDCAVRLDVEYIFSRPKSHWRTVKGAQSGTPKESAPFFHTSKPDLDNLDKAVKDALVNAGVLKDDSLVCECAQRRKRYQVNANERPGAIIRITELRNNTMESIHEWTA